MDRKDGNGVCHFVSDPRKKFFLLGFCRNKLISLYINNKEIFNEKDFRFCVSNNTIRVECVC